MAILNQQSKPQIFEIQKPYVIICEGNDDSLFLNEYLRYLDKYKIINQNTFNIIKANGVTNIAKEMKNYKNYQNYDYMKGFLFVRDADNTPTNAVDSMIGNIRDVWGVTLNKSGDFKKDSDGIKIGFFIFPGLDDSGNYRKGTLEDFCVEVFNLTGISNRFILSSVEDYMKKLSETNITFKTPHKNRLHLCLDSTNDFLGDKIGEAAKKHAFDFNSNIFSTLRARIIDLTR